MSVLANYEPKNVFSYFEKLCTIPRGSGNTDGVASYLVSFAKEHGLESYRDAANNVIIRKPASAGYENADTIILQGHHDMVCEKEEGLDFDFTKDAIQPVIDGDWIRAKGTTLGGDNGIAVAMILAILADDSLAHPPIEALITADEEIGMLGAFALDCSQLKGHKLINLDSEYEGILMCSCAGGVNVRSTVPVARETVTGAAVDIVIKGLTSGHSGVEIDKGRANANALMGRMLCELAAKEDFRLAALEGGSRETAIAASSSAQIIVEPGKAAGVCEVVRKLGAQYASEYATAEPNMQVNAVAGKTGTVEVLTQAGTEKVWQVLVSLPDSVQAMCIDMPGLVQTSTNFGTLKLEENALVFSNTVRSSITAQKEWIVEKIAAIVKLAGGTTTTDGNYPGWAYNPHSVVKDTILAAYKKLFNKEATVEAVHAGIECGLFSDSIPNLDCVSIGPDMGDVHTPREHLSIASSQRTYELLKLVLAESK